MDDSIEELYQEIILDHSRRPRNFGSVRNSAISVTGENPACGDKIEVTVRFDEVGTVEDIKFTGHGCAITQASASMMTVRLKGKGRNQALDIFRAFRGLLMGERRTSAEKLGDLEAMQGVREFPLRVKCAMLPWRAAEEALLRISGKFTISTEAG